jgi:hypothetical protein
MQVDTNKKMYKTNNQPNKATVVEATTATTQENGRQQRKA